MADYAVNCYTCLKNIWQGDTAPSDGQVLLTAYADSVAGTACPSGRSGCPHKATAVAARALLQPATLADLTGMKTRLDKIEAKVKP